jgi:hypothetical protein
MPNPNLDAAALQAGITGKQKEQIDGLSKLLDSHKNLLALPSDQAKQTFNNMPQDQKVAHVALFGGGKGPVGWLGDAAHYLTNEVKTVVAAPFKALNEVSDFMTRLYRTGAIAVDQGVNLGQAFKTAGDKGDKVFSPGRIADAQNKFGLDMMSVAMKVASGITLSEITATGSDAEKQIAADAAQLKDKDHLFQAALDAAQAAKYSPGRQLANMIPGLHEGSGFLYKGISGIVDAGYRIFADPTLLLGKAKKAYDAGDFLLYNLLGKEKFTYGRNLMATAGNATQVDRVFSNKGTQVLFDNYGAALEGIKTARTAGNAEAGAAAYQRAKTLIPEFGDAGINQLIEAGVKDSTTAANFLKNHADVKDILTGQAARKTPLVPTMSPARAIKVATYTTANKIFNIDKAGQNIVKAIYGDGTDVVTGLAEKTKQIGELEAGVGKTGGKLRDGSIRFTNNQVSGRIDRFMRKFTTVPHFENGFFDVMGKNAPDTIYQLSALANTRYHSRIIKEAFAAGDEGQRKQIFIGLWNTISEVRQVTRTKEGKNFVDQFSGHGLDYKYAADLERPVANTKLLPKGIEIENLGSENTLANKKILENQYGLNKQMANSALDANTLIAKDSNGNYVGHISWNKDTGKINLVNVASEYQRKGIASNLLEQAKNIKNAVSPVHEENVKNLSPEGAAWKTAVSSKAKEYETWNPAQFGDQQMALHAYQLSSSLAVPSILDMDRLSAHSGIINRVLGVSHKKWAERLTSNWSIGTLAGPKFPVRNAAEDTMLHLAVGDNAWGMAKGRLVSTQIRKVQEAEAGLTGEQRKVGAEIADLQDKIDSVKPGSAAHKAAMDDIAVKKKELRELEGNKIKFYESKLGFVNRLIGRNQVKEYQARIAEAGNDVNKVRQVMTEAIFNNRLASRALSDKDKEFLKEFSQYGRIQEQLDAVSEGGKNAMRGGDYSTQASTDASRYGTLRALEYDGKKYKQAGGTFTDYSPVANDQARLGWLVKLALHSGDELDSILIKNLDNKELAIKELTNYLDNNPALRARFQLYSENIGATSYQHAERAYADVLNTFSKADGTLNKELWNKVRKVGPENDIRVSTRSLSIDDLPAKADAAMHPRFISGPTLVPVAENENMTSSIVNKTWDYMGEANSRFSREALVLNAMLDFRKQMEETGYAQALYKQLNPAGTSGVERAIAHRKAMEHITSVAEDLAKNHVIAFVDNPAVRSQLAMSVRNFARFYRATEDFYRRVYRTVKYNPEALVRASLTYEGIAHSGFVQTDENGNQYFFYPGLTPVYQVMNKVMKAFGVSSAFQAPMPVQFGAQLKMVTPSMNPDSLFPTFAGPLAAVPINAIGNIVPQFKSLEQYLTGAQGADQPMISALLPAHANRLLQALNTDDRNSQYASAARKAATYLEATGHGLKVKIDPETGLEIPPTAGELADFQTKLQASSLTVLGLRFVMGFVAPASPSVVLKSDMAQWVRDNGQTTYKSVFNDLIRKYGDIDQATKEWLRLYPDQMPYTVSETESTVAASVQAVSGATDWINKNGDLLKKYPQAASFLIPRAGTFDYNAYKLLMKSGLKVNKSLTDFVAQSTSARDVQTYYNKKDEYDQQMSLALDITAKRQLTNDWQDWSTQFKGARPLLQQELSQGSQKAINRLNALNDLRIMLADTGVKDQPALRDTLATMLSTYDNYVNQRDSATALSVVGNVSDYKNMLKVDAKNTIQSLAGTDANAVAAFNTLFAPLFR